MNLMLHSTRRDRKAYAPATAIALRDVRKHYGRGDGAVVALDGVSVGIAPGSFTAVMGPSGSGKSTFLNVAAGLDRPTSGSVSLGDTELASSERTPADGPATRADRVRLPGVQPAALAHGRAEHRAAAAPGRASAAALGGARGRGAGRAREAPAPPSLAALRRPAAAGGDRAGAGHPARGRVRRRADRSARHPHRTRRARAPARDRRRGRPHGRDGHPRPAAAAYADRVILLADGRVAGTLEAPSADEVAEQLAHLGD